MNIHLRTAGLHDVAFLADVVIKATLAQRRFPSNMDLIEYRTGYEEWTREMVMGNIPNCTLSVIEQDGVPIGRLRVLRDDTSITLAGIQLLPDFQNAQRFYKRLGFVVRGEDNEEYHLEYHPRNRDRSQSVCR